MFKSLLFLIPAAGILDRENIWRNKKLKIPSGKKILKHNLFKKILFYYFDEAVIKISKSLLKDFYRVCVCVCLYVCVCVRVW